MYYRSANAVIIVFDVTRQRTFDDVKFWVSEVVQKGSQGCLLLIVGNKIDKEDREVLKTTAEQYAKSVGALYTECSALSGDGVEKCFVEIGKKKVGGG